MTTNRPAPIPLDACDHCSGTVYLWPAGDVQCGTCGTHYGRATTPGERTALIAKCKGGRT